MACRSFLLASAMLLSAKARSGFLANSSQGNAITQGGSVDRQSIGEGTPSIATGSIQLSNASQAASPVAKFPECGFDKYGDGCRNSGADGCGAKEGFIACDIVQDDVAKPSWTKRGKCTKTAYALETSFGCLQAPSKNLLQSVSIPSLVEALYTNSATGTCSWWDLKCKTLVNTAHGIGEIKQVTAVNDCHAMGYTASVCIGSTAVSSGCDGGSPFYMSGLDIHCAMGPPHGPHTYPGGTVNAICGSARQFGCQP